MKKNTIKRLTACLLLLVTLLSVSVGCGDAGEPTRLSFKSALGYDYLKTLDGRTVTINGYMATSSPVDGSFMFLMNMPYQSCPFCLPNTSQLSNTIEIYPRSGDSFRYTEMAIRVTGRLVVAPSEDEPFTDAYGYVFNFKIVDATYTVIKAEELSADLALWQSFAESGVMNDLTAMYDYLHFVCAWNTYYVSTHTDKNGNLVKGYYLNDTDAKYYLMTDGAQWNYGYKDGYFDALVAKVEAVDKTAFGDLVANIRKAEALAQKAISELENGNFTREIRYLEQFDNTDYVYTLNKEAELSAEEQEIYSEFSHWLAGWEM